MRCCAEARAAKENGPAPRCMGTAWRQPKDRDRRVVCAMIKGVARRSGSETRVTLGMLTGEHTARLKSARPRLLQPQSRYLAGVLRARSSRQRTYQERLDTLAHVRDAGIRQCAAAALSAWARSGRTASAWSRRAGDPAAHPEFRADQHAGARRRHAVENQGRARSVRIHPHNRGGAHRACRRRWCGLSAGREDMSEERRRCVSSPAQIRSSAGRSF